MDTRTSGALGGAAQGAATGAQFGGPWGAVIGGVIGAGLGALGGGGEDDVEKLAEIQKHFAELETEETVRRMRLQAEQELGYAKAAAYASNLQFTGSTRTYYNAMETEHRRQVAWERASLAKEKWMIDHQAGSTIDAMQNRGISDMLGSGFSAFSSAGGMDLFGGGESFTSTINSTSNSVAGGVSHTSRSRYTV